MPRIGRGRLAGSLLATRGRATSAILQFIYAFGVVPAARGRMAGPCRTVTFTPIEAS